MPLRRPLPRPGIFWRTRVSSHSIERRVSSILGAGQLLELCLHALKVDRLSNKLCCAILRRLPPSLVITVSGYHHDGQVGKALLDLTE
jgi:hypothetical protein